MFTGIVTHRGQLADLRVGSSAEAATTLVIDPGASMPVSIGDSVAIDGVCLTVAGIDGQRLTFEAIPETLRKTALGDRAVDDRVNLEAALRLGDPLGGHWVQGHVDGTGTLLLRETQGQDVRLVIEVPATLHEGLLSKGSVTLDGVSLTVGEVWREEASCRFSVYLIPHTLEVTGFGPMAVGQRINVEVDVLGRYVAQHVARILGAQKA